MTINTLPINERYLLDAEGRLTDDALDQPLDIARKLAADFALTAIERDYIGGTPKQQRDDIRTSGLLALIIPKQYGGLGANWQQTMQIVREFAKADSSIAHVFAFHHLMLATVRLFSKPEQWQPWFEQTARQNWFWGNALNPMDERTVSRSFSNWREFSGKKSFCSGALDSEMLIASAIDPSVIANGKPRLLIAALPTGRTGIHVIQDWDNMGQRQTDSGSVNFERVRVEENEILSEPGPLNTPFSCLRPLVAQLILTNIYLGIAEGAFEDARQYTLDEARPWHTSNVATTSQDPYVLGHYGDFWVGLESTKALTELAAAKLDWAWHQDANLTEADRGEVAVCISAAKVLATRVGLDITSRMFEVTGSRATHAGLRLDRHWRNLRTHTLHDPLDYKIKELGDWALNESYPDPSFYS